MARCGCSGASCSCVVTGSGSVTVTGAGSVSNPYVITSDVNLEAIDSGSIDLTMTGDGSQGNPYRLSATAALDLNDLLDVDTAGGITGQVLALQSDGSYRLVPPNTAGPGAITVGNGIAGDGSSGSPLSVKLAASSGLTLDASGLKVTNSGEVWQNYTPALTASSTNPTIGNGSLEGRYTQNGKTITVSIEITIGSTTKRGVGAWRVSLPVAPSTARKMVLAVQVAAVGSADYIGVGKIEAQQRVERIFIATSTAAQAMSHSVPSALGAGSVIIITGSYEAA